MSKPPESPGRATPPPKDRTKAPDKIIDFSTLAKQRNARSKSRMSKAAGITLCKRGFHKWADDPRKQFDVKQGRLVSISTCKRCGLKKTLAS